MLNPTGWRLMEMFHILLNRFGPQNWWLADTDLEMILGAVLTQNTRWTNVKKAMANLESDGLLSMEALQAVPARRLAQKIRSSGFFNIKAARIKNLINFITLSCDGGLIRCLNRETGILRENLLSKNGIGPETADSIILYGARRPLFVIDAYTHRILNRHGIVDDQAGYDDVQELFIDNLPADIGLYNEFHALLVRTGNKYCRKKPQCGDCPLEGWME